MALAEHHALFGGDEHAATLRAQREEALEWPRRLAEFRPVLVGGVAAGWASEHSDIRLELVADDAKAVELALINAGIDYRLPPQRRAEAPPELIVDTPAAAYASSCAPTRSGGNGRSGTRKATPRCGSRQARSRRCWTRTPRPAEPAPHGHCATRQASARRGFAAQPPRSVEREVREDGVGAGALHAGQRLEHAGALVEPARPRTRPSASRIHRTPGRPRWAGRTCPSRGGRCRGTAARA